MNDNETGIAFAAIIAFTLILIVLIVSAASNSKYDKCVEVSKQPLECARLLD